MSKLKKLIRQLNDQEVRHIHKALVDTDATKSAELLHLFKEGLLEDSKIKELLDVNNNAYYTLRSRLNDKIETFILEKTKNPRTDLLKQVASIKDLIYTKSRIISLASLLKLEKELLSYNLHNELSEVYLALRKLHIHDKKYFEYSQLYNQQVALVHANNLAQDYLVNYFKFFGEYLIDKSELNQLKLDTSLSELKKLSEAHESNRVLILYLCTKTFHDSFFQTNNWKKVVLDIKQAKDIIDSHLNDSLYYQFDIIFEYHLCLLYYFGNNPLLKNQAQVFEIKIRKNHIGFYYNTYPNFILNIYDELNLNGRSLPNWNDAQNSLLMQCNQSAFEIAQLLKKNKEKEALEVVKKVFSLKKIKHLDKIYTDFKVIELCLLWNLDRFNEVESNIKGIQRLIRNLGKEEVHYSAAVLKVLISISSKISPDKKINKITQANQQLDAIDFPIFSPMRIIGKTFFKNLRIH